MKFIILFKKTTISALFVLLFSLTSNAQIYTQIGLDIDGDNQYSKLGNAVSLSSDGSIVAIGAQGYNESRGQVRIYEWNGTSWNQRGAGIDGEAPSDLSGSSLSLSSDGSIVAIGAYGNDVYSSNTSANIGHVRVFSWNGETWEQRGSDIDGESTWDNFGRSVSISADGSIVAIGAPKNSGTDQYAGHVRVYFWNGTTWMQQGSDIDGEAGNDESGTSVSLSADGTVVAIGAINAEGGDGHIRVYSWNGTSWTLRGTDIVGEYGNKAGSSVSLSADGTVVAFGAPYTGGSYAGEVIVYVWDGVNWVQRGSILTGYDFDDQAGISVSLSSDGTVVAFGSYGIESNSSAGKASVYVWNGSDWSQLGNDLEGEAADDLFGSSLSLSSDGSTIAVGAPINNSYSGHVRVFEYPKMELTGGTGWRMLSSPIFNSTYTNVFANFWTQGFEGSNAPLISVNQASVLLFNGTTFAPPESLNTTINSGSGFIAYLYEDNNLLKEGIQGGFPKTVLLSGEEHSSPVNFSANGGAGVYSLAGNPFLSSIDWDVVQAASTNIHGTVYVYDPTYTATINDGEGSAQAVGAYRAWNGSVGGLSNGIIAPFQGFWVEATNATATVSFTESAKTTGGTFHGKKKNIPKIRLIATHENGASNDAYIQFSELGSEAFDKYDGWKFNPLTSNFLLISSGYINGKALDINNLPLLDNEIEIPIGLETTMKGTYTLEVENDLKNSNLYIIDSFSGIKTLLNDEIKYSFEVSLVSKAASKKEINQPDFVVSTMLPRFTLVVSPLTSTNVEKVEKEIGLTLAQNFPNPFNPSTIIQYSLPSAGKVSLTVYDMLGRKISVLVDAIKTAGKYEQHFDASNLPSGMYLYRLDVNGFSQTRNMTLIK